MINARQFQVWLRFFGFTALIHLLVEVPCLEAVEFHQKYALLIAVTNYKHPLLNEPQLNFPEEDAKALATFLEASGYQVELLLGKSATHNAILKKLNGLTDQAESAGVVLVGLFGHGIEVATFKKNGQLIVDSNGDPVTEACFCSHDTAVRTVKDGQGRVVKDNNGSSMTEPNPGSLIKFADVMKSLGVAKAQNRVVLMDCCHKTPNGPKGKSFGASLKSTDLPSNTAVLLGSSPGQSAFEYKDRGHGAFTECLLDELAVMSGEGKVETLTLMDRLIEKVPVLVATKSRDKQIPTIFSTGAVDLQLTTSLVIFDATRSRTADEAVNVQQLWLARLKGQWETTNSIGMEFILIPPGRFRMGSPKEEKNRAAEYEEEVEVTLTRVFGLGKTEVTKGQWETIMETTPWLRLSGVKESALLGVKHDATYPAQGVSWDDAMEFCKKLTERERRTGRLPKDWEYTLPTEAQWEFACRAGTTTAYGFGSDARELTNFGWFGMNHGGNTQDEKYAHEVGLKKPNNWGLSDMHGNIHELCRDGFEKKLLGGKNPEVTHSGEYNRRVVRGGSFYSDGQRCCRSAYRSGCLEGEFGGPFVGFRVARVQSNSSVSEGVSQ
jgi:formylglycine-generating enzyme required for sulfatase activity